MNVPHESAPPALVGSVAFATTWLMVLWAIRLLSRFTLTGIVTAICRGGGISEECCSPLGHAEGAGGGAGAVLPNGHDGR